VSKRRSKLTNATLIRFRQGYSQTIATFRVFAKESVTFTWPLWQDSSANDQDTAYV